MLFDSKSIYPTNSNRVFTSEIQVGWRKMQFNIHDKHTEIMTDSWKCGDISPELT